MKYKLVLLLICTLLLYGCYKVETSVQFYNFHFSADRSHFNYKEVYFTLPNKLENPTVHWDFGDGSTSSEPHPTHLFPGNGKYLVSCTVTGYEGFDYHTTDFVNISDYHTEKYYIDTLVYKMGSALDTAINPSWAIDAYSERSIENNPRHSLFVNFDPSQNVFKLGHMFTYYENPWLYTYFEISIFNVSQPTEYRLPPAGVYTENFSKITFNLDNNPGYSSNEPGLSKSYVNISRSDSVMELDFQSKLYHASIQSQIFKGFARVRRINWYY